MLRQEGVDYEYRDYVAEPLDVEEIHRVLGLLEVTADQVLRKRDKAYRDLELDGSESEDRLIELMTRFPTLLQRPIALHAGRAVIGRPPERVLELLNTTPNATSAEGRTSSEV